MNLNGRLDRLEKGVPPPPSDYYPRLHWVGLEGHPAPPEWAHPIVEAYVTGLHGTRVYEHTVYYHVDDDRLYVQVGYKRGWLEVTPDGMRPVEGLPVLVQVTWEAARVISDLSVPPSSPEYPMFVSRDWATEHLRPTGWGPFQLLNAYDGDRP